MIRVLACLALMFFLLPMAPARDSIKPYNDSQFIALKQIPFNPDDSKQRGVGALDFLTGWELSSQNSNFGGISALAALPNDRFVGLSDAGTLIGFTLTDGTSANRPFIAPLPDGPGTMEKKSDRDSESLIHDPATGRYWVGFEHNHSVWRYGRAFSRAESSNAPELMQGWPSNGGAEAMLRLPGDRFIVFSEAGDGPGNSHMALIFDGDPSEPSTSIQTFGYRPPEGYRVTDAALLPDGRALLLNRRFTILEGVSAIISIADPAEIKAGEVFEGQEIARLKSPIAVDNMEGIAVTQEGQKTVIWLVSDDNFSSLQRTLLLKFALNFSALSSILETKAESPANRQEKRRP